MLCVDASGTATPLFLHSCPAASSDPNSTYITPAGPRTDRPKPNPPPTPRRPLPPQPIPLLVLPVVPAPSAAAAAAAAELSFFHLACNLPRKLDAI